MRIGILGTGVVGQTLGRGLVKVGHQVTMGSRSANNEKATKWVAEVGAGASSGTFADAAAGAELVLNCTAGNVSLDALRQAGAKNLAGKILIDVSNALDFTHGFPPTLTICNTDSVAEQIQREFPDAKVVKSLNTMSSVVMTNPGIVPGEHDVFVSGNDAAAKATVADLLRSFGWRSIIDLGDITTARGVEMVLPIWLRLMGTLKTPQFNFHIARV